MAKITLDDSKADFFEQCPECDEEVGVVYDKKPEDDYDYEQVCPYCGKKLMLCMMCHDDYGDICDWTKENSCRISRKEYPKLRIWEEEKKFNDLAEELCEMPNSYQFDGERVFCPEEAMALGAEKMFTMSGVHVEVYEDLEIEMWCVVRADLGV